MASFFQKLFFISALCFLSGSLCALAMAPHNIWPVFLIGFGVLYWAIDKAQSKKSAFTYGWLWAFGYFVFSLYWIGNALLVEGNPYKWAWPLAVCGLPALLAFFNGFACLFIKRFLDLKQWSGYLGFVCTLSLFEYARGYVFTGFPWNLYGYTWVDVPIAQLAAFESIYFLTLVTLFWMSIAGYWIVGTGKLSKRIFNVVILISFFGSFQFGVQQLEQDVQLHDVIVKIVQPNTPQHEKWKRDKMEGHFETALHLSKPDENDNGKTLIVWPETTLSPAFLNTPRYRDQITDMLRTYSGDAILMTGALQFFSDTQSYYNSLLTIDKAGKIDRVYNKTHLVPFGEYIPFQRWIPLKPVVQFQGFQKGDGLQDFNIFNGLNYSPLICYEIIFPNRSVKAGSVSDFIVNVTNDAWYGDSPGPHQHLVKARFRAIEEGRPVLRAANTGISAIIDPYGRISMATKTFTQNNLSTNLPTKRSKLIESSILSFLLFPLLPVTLLILIIANSYMRVLKD